MRLFWSPDERCLRRDTSPCPYAAGWGRCVDCPQVEFEAMQRSQYGQLVEAAVELRSMIVDGLHISPDQVPADEYYALRVLREEEPKTKEPNGEHTSAGPPGR